MAFTSLGRRALPNQWDLIALSLIFGLFVLVVRGSHDMTAPLPPTDAPTITLDYAYLPYYALRTTLRMFLALAASLVFTLTYATLAAKSRRAETVLIPLLDVLQSVPILGFLSFTVTFFLGLFPGSTLGAEMACIFAIFTSQAWNMAFSFYQSLRTVPGDLDEVSEGFRLSPWQKFWQLETPFAMPGLIYNTMMSMSGGWFFVVAAEAITVGDTTIKLPGIGSYLATAIDRKDIAAVLVAVVVVLVVILLYDQLMFRPIVAFSDKFKVELSASQTVSKSWVLDLLARTFWVRRAAEPLARAFDWFTSLRLDLPRLASPPRRAVADRRPRRRRRLVRRDRPHRGLRRLAGDPVHRHDARLARRWRDGGADADHHGAGDRAPGDRQPRLGADRGVDRAPARASPSACSPPRSSSPPFRPTWCSPSRWWAS